MKAKSRLSNNSQSDPVFTLNGDGGTRSANKAIKYLSLIVDDLIGVYRNVVDLRRKLDSPDKRHSYHEKLYDQYMDQLHGLGEEIAEAGGVICDFDRGVISLVGLHNGVPIKFYWSPRDEQIMWWSYATEDLAERKPVSTMYQIEEVIQKDVE